MKKINKTLVFIFVTMLVYMGLSWLINSGSLASGEFVATEKEIFSLTNLFRVPLASLLHFGYVAIFILSIGFVYAVLQNIGAYNKIVDKLTKFKYMLYIIPAIIIALNSILGVADISLVLIPFFLAILFKQNYSKLTAFAATFGALLVGFMVPILNPQFLMTAEGYFGLEVNYIFMIAVALIIYLGYFYILIKNKKMETRKDSNANLELIGYVEEKEKTSILPITVISALFILLSLITMANFDYIFGIEFFAGINESIAELPIIGGLVGDLPVFGGWGMFDYSIGLIVFGLLLTWIYSIKVEKVLESSKKVLAKFLKPAILGSLAYTLYLLIAMFETNIITTISDSLMTLGEGFNIIIVTIVTFITTIFNVDYANTMYNGATIFQLYAPESTSIAYVFQYISGLAFMILPTSIYLLVGINLLDIKFIDWYKYIYKFLIFAALVFIILISVLGSVL